MKIIVGLGGAPKNPSHGDMVTVAHRSKAGRYLDETVQCIYRTSQDLAIPSHDLTIRYHSFIAPRRTFTRPGTRGTLPHRNATLPYFTTPLLVVMTLHHNPNNTDLRITIPPQHRTAQYFTIPLQNRMVQYITDTSQDVTTP